MKTEVCLFQVLRESSRASKKSEFDQEEDRLILLRCAKKLPARQDERRKRKKWRP